MLIVNNNKASSSILHLYYKANSNFKIKFLNGIFKRGLCVHPCDRY
jgi:hypothetical protein